jgi:hypothetical protein
MKGHYFGEEAGGLTNLGEGITRRFELIYKRPFMRTYLSGWGRRRQNAELGRHAKSIHNDASVLYPGVESHGIKKSASVEERGSDVAGNVATCPFMGE